MGETGSAAVDVHVKPTCLQPKGNYNIICRSVSLHFSKKYCAISDCNRVMVSCKKGKQLFVFLRCCFCFQITNLRANMSAVKSENEEVKQERDKFEQENALLKSAVQENYELKQKLNQTEGELGASKAVS